MTVFQRFILGSTVVLLLGSCQKRPSPVVQASEGSPSRVADTWAAGEAKIWMHDPLLRRYARHLLRGSIPIDSSGAVGQNRTPLAPIQVGWQREGFKAISYGLSARNRNVVERGIRAYEWAFMHQDASGLFGNSGYPEIVSFLGSYGRSMRLLQHSGYPDLADRLAANLPRVHRTLTNPVFLQHEQRWSSIVPTVRDTNQILWSALDYHFIYQITGQAHYKQQSLKWMDIALEKQRENGVFPEQGGSDTHYQAVSLEKLLLFKLHAKQVRSIDLHLRAGFRWLSQKITRQYRMDTSENTRTGQQQERGPSGRFKEGRYGNPEIYILWSYLGGGAWARSQAEGLMQRIISERLSR